MTAFFYEDFEVGAEHETTGRTITESDLVQFAALTGDWNRLHTDEEYCRTTMYGHRIAHGLFGLAIMEGMRYRLGHTDGTAVASLNWNVTFTKPIYIGDTVRVRIRISSKRETRHADRGIVMEQVQLVNQRDEVVTEAEHGLMMLRRPA